MCGPVVALYILRIQNENRNDCRHVSLELETVVFDKKKEVGVEAT